MLGDRDYMRAGDYRAPMTLTAKLTIAMVAIFALQQIDAVYLHTSVARWLALTREGLLSGWVWQLITFQFLHGGLWHLIFNLVVFWWLGRFCEQLMGKARFLVALLGCGAVGGLLQGVLMIAAPVHFGFATVGASAGVSGLLAIFALLARDQVLRLYFIFPIRAIVLLYALIGISLFFTLVPSPAGGVAHAAHLGGLLAGVAWIKLGWHHDYIRLPWENWWDAWRARRARQSVRLPRPGPARVSVTRPRTAASTGPTEFISREVDPILDKIAAHGIHSLTDEERKILENARSRMEKR